MTESNQRVVITKRMLKEGLMRLLKEKSLDKISITELCREAGINRTTFYRHYEWPRDVLTEMQNDFFAETFDHFQKPMTAHDVERLFACLADHAELVTAFFRYNSDTDWMQLFTRIYTSFPVRQMVKAFQNIDEVQAELLSTYLAGGAYFLARKWIMDDMPISPKEAAEVVLNVLDKEKVF